MVDKDGLFIAHPNKEYILKLNIKEQDGMKEITEKMLARQTGTASYAFNGVDKIAAFAPVSATGWSVCATQNEAGVSLRRARYNTEFHSCHRGGVSRTDGVRSTVLRPEHHRTHYESRRHAE
jgi:hypothetical protein